MKKLLIPFIGLLILILLTPFILGKMANSNIDTKIGDFKKAGFKIKELKHNITYLDSNREFEVILDKDTNNKTWKAYPFLKKVKVIINLKFKNLPITKADMDIKVDYIKINNSNYSYLKGLVLNLITKDFKHFKYNIKNVPENFKIKLNGIAENKKYTNLEINSEVFDYIPYFKSEGNKLNLTLKSLKLALFNSKWNGKKWSFKNGNILLKGEDSNETFSSHLAPNNKYTIDDIFNSKKLALKVKDFYIAFGDFNWKLKIDNFTKVSMKNMDLNLSINWNKTEYKNSMVGGGKIKLSFKILQPTLKTLKDIELNMEVSLDKNLFKKITIDLDPKIVNKWFKNYKSNIKIKNGVVTANENRIQ